MHERVHRRAATSTSTDATRAQAPVARRPHLPVLREDDARERAARDAAALASAPTEMPVPPAPRAATPAPSLFGVDVESGRPLDAATRALFEPRLGVDLGAVRVHEGKRASASARALGASAYSVGTHVVFGRGAYAPSTTSGRRLLGHELAHIATAPAGGGEIALEPLSLTRDVDPAALSDADLQHEIQEIRTWLAAHEASSPERDLLTAALTRLEQHVAQAAPAVSVSASPPVASAEAAATAARPRQTSSSPSPVAQPAPAAAPLASGVVDAPRSLGRSPDFSSWTADEIRDEVRRISAWLQAHPVDSAENEALANTLSVLEQSLRGGSPRTPAPSGAAPPPLTGSAPFFGLPIAPNAVHGAQLFYLARSVPHTDRVRSETILRRRPYMIVPQLAYNAAGAESIAYYIAYRNEPGLLGPTNWNEWIVGPDTIEAFLANLGSYSAQGAFAYSSGPPSETQAASARWLAGTGTYGEALGTAARDPGWWLQMVLGLSGAAAGPAAAEADALGGEVAAEGGGAPAATAARQPFVPRVIQGGGGSAPSTVSNSAARASAFDGSAARALETTPAPQPALRVVPDLEPAPTPATTPTPAAVPATTPVPLPAAPVPLAPAVGAIGAVAASRTGSPARAPSTEPAPSPQPSPAPQPAPDEEQRRGRCPAGSVPIRWPFPVWTLLGHGDRGATSGINDRPPTPIVVKRVPPERNRTIVGEYVRENWAALRPFYERGTLGAVHHKWPLYLGGPDTKANFVFLRFGEHTGWHSVLTTQTVGPVGTRYCIVN